MIHNDTSTSILTFLSNMIEIITKLIKVILIWQIIFWHSGWKSEISKLLNWAQVCWYKRILQQPHKQNYSDKQVLQESGGYETVHSGITSRINVQTYARQKQCSLCNREKLFKHQHCINDTLKLYHQSYASKNNWQGVTWIHLHQAPIGDHPFQINYSSSPKTAGWYHISMLTIPLHQ